MYYTFFYQITVFREKYLISYFLLTILRVLDKYCYLNLNAMNHILYIWQMTEILHYIP